MSENDTIEKIAENNTKQIADDNFPLSIKVIHQKGDDDDFLDDRSHTFDEEEDVYKMFNLAYKNQTCLVWSGFGNVPKCIYSLTYECNSINAIAFIPEGAKEPIGCFDSSGFGCCSIRNYEVLDDESEVVGKFIIGTYS
jgi:hypothetical protein